MESPCGDEYCVKTHEIRLYPTKAQGVLLKKSCGVARYSYNWALSKWKEIYESGGKPSVYSLVKLQNSIKRTEMPFFMEVCKSAPQYAIHDLGRAFISFFNGNTRYPKFKKAGKRDSFVSVEKNDDFKQKNYKIWIPRLGWVKCAENLRFEGKVNNVVIKRTADMWFACVNIEVPKSIPALKHATGENQAIVGVDLGISNMMVLSDGTVYQNPRALRSNLERLKRLQRRVSRKIKGSKNRYKEQIRLARKYYRISCIRKNAIHQATNEIIRKYDRIVIESLNVGGMMKNHKLAQAIGDVGFGEIVKQLGYKAMWHGKEIIKVDRLFPSTKTCSNCGNKKEIKLSERTYHCDACGLSIDRDLNAAKNLAKYGSTSKPGGSYACGDGSSLVGTQDSPSKKQELICKSLKTLNYELGVA